MKDINETGPTVRIVASPVNASGGANSVRHHINEAGLGYPEAGPDVRLAITGYLDHQSIRDQTPDVRLAISGEVHGERGKHLSREITLQGSPTVRLAHYDAAQGSNALRGHNGAPMIERAHAPALLVSYVYVKPFLENQVSYCYRDWVLDSGAFSAHMSKTKIELQDYINFCKAIMAADPTLTEVFALDVIGNAEASLKNTEEMWRQGVPAIPCFHADEPEEFLIQMAKDYPKIALGGVALAKGDQKHGWAEQCFARVWPKKIHGFGFGSEDGILSLPWDSVDSTNWEIGPCAFGRWNRFGAMSVRGSKQDLRCEVKWFLDLEERARVKWAKEMQQLTELPDPENPVSRLALVFQNQRQADRAKLRAGLGSDSPAVRRAFANMSDGRVSIQKQTAIIESLKPPAPVKPAKETKPEPVATAPVEKSKPKNSSEISADKDFKYADYWKNRL